MLILFGRIAGAKRAEEPPLTALPAPLLIAAVVAVALIAWGLRKFVLYDFDLSRDEQMVAFDSAIFAKGQLFAPFPPAWREWYSALNVMFVLPIGDREGWVSAYLPGNAALRALVDTVLPDAFVSPLLLIVAGVSLWRIARLIWPGSAETQTVVMLLFAGSSQAILMATTRYAMTAHLAANLVWLWLFLQRRPAAHAGAIGIGWLATGLHQPVFHPIFVVPFLDMLRRERRWGVLVAYILSYGCIGLFWLSWPGWISSHGIHPTPAGMQVEGVSYLDRLRHSVTAVHLNSFGVMGANLLRFVAWQHLLVLPLMIIGLRTSFAKDPLCRALALGMGLLVVAMLVLLPAQAHGWGYRYLHGFIGSAALIAGFGWHELARSGVALRRSMRWTTAVSLLVILPLHVWMARIVIAPHAHARAELAQLPADVVIVDDKQSAFGSDLVLNRPDLSNRPILLLTSKLSSTALVRLCASGRTLAFTQRRHFAEINRMFNYDIWNDDTPKHKRLQQTAHDTGCRVLASSPMPTSASAVPGHG
jgi:hypothetical protein